MFTLYRDYLDQTVYVMYVMFVVCNCLISFILAQTELAHSICMQARVNKTADKCRLFDRGVSNRIISPA